MHKPDVLFVLTIDTEEEWQWDQAFPQTQCSIDNVNKLPGFQAECEKLGVRPTYFVDYAVAENHQACEMLAQFYATRKAEIGAHLHPWCNPPFFGPTTEVESHVINLPYDQVAQKLDSLSALICNNTGCVPRSFRSGRWGASGETLQLLASRGYQVDSSVYPFYKNEFFSCEGAPLVPYWPDFDDALTPGEQRLLLEVPVSAGFNIANFSLGNTIHNVLASPSLSWTKSVGLLWHSHMLRKIYLSPELTDSQNMCALIDACLANNHPVIHMYLHSSSLIDGATGLTDLDNANECIIARIQSTIAYLSTRANVRYCTISEAAQLIKQRQSEADFQNERLS